MNANTQQFYIIESDYVGPNEKDSSGNWIGETWHTFQICNAPGTKNMSGEECIHGWLGTTNDWCLNAHGEYETLEEARAYIHGKGFSEEMALDEGKPDESIVEIWITPSASLQQWDAGDWLDGITYRAKNNLSVTIEGLPEPITKKTTPEQLEQYEAIIESWVDDDGTVELHGLTDYLQSCVDMCDYEDEDEA